MGENNRLRKRKPPARADMASAIRSNRRHRASGDLTYHVFEAMHALHVAADREANRDVLRLFNPEKIDVLTFTSYLPAVEGITHPEEIPDDHYAKAFDYFPEKAMGFSELGWPPHEALGGAQGQADFLTHCVHRLTTDQGVDVEFLGWVWLHDLDDNDSIGWKRRDGTSKLAYDVWKTL